MAVGVLVTNREDSSICTEQIVTSEAFPYGANICGRENDCGKALTNFQPMCDEFNSVHKAMKSKVEPAMYVCIPESPLHLQDLS